MNEDLEPTVGGAGEDLQPASDDDLPPGMAHFTLVLLRRPPDAPAYPEAELDRIQEAHLDYLDLLRRDGALLAAGPFRDQRDEQFRGLSVFATSLEETRRLTEADPAVRAGRLAVEVATWWILRSDLPLEAGPD